MSKNQLHFQALGFIIDHTCLSQPGKKSNQSAFSTGCRILGALSGHGIHIVTLAIPPVSK